MIRSHDGKFIEAKTLLDSCNQINCFSTEFAKHLNVKKIKTFAPVCRLNNRDMTLNHKIKTLIANKEETFLRELEFLIIPKITEITPQLAK